MSNITKKNLQKKAVITAYFTTVPNIILGKNHGYITHSDKLNITVASNKYMKDVNIEAVDKTENIVTLCAC